ncbi:MAG TPA: substrate-binding domain-containing protein [Bacteroidales bacterium]|nr:substrate-binding domain-containing protein [Bacteroidales bacterium]HPO66001.1 substrate-binding domain-containing protein [Bacteroidales bacterium]
MIRSKKIALLFGVMLLLLGACEKKAEMKIALMFPYTTSARMQFEEKYFKAKAAEMNCEAIITDAKNDEVLQRKQATELLDQGVKVLVIMAVNAYTAAEIVREAHNKGAYVIGYDRLIFNSDLDFYISHNNYNVGKYMAEYALKLKPNGKYLLLGGDKGDRNAIFVKTGQLDALKPAVTAGNVKIVLDVYVDEWLPMNAYHIMKEYLRLSANDVPDVILTSYDGLGRAARQALDEAGITQEVIITGQDAEPQTIKYILQGKQTLTIYKPLKPLAENAVITAVKLSKGEKPDTTTSIFNNRKMVPALLFEPIPVDKNNVRETVVKDGIISEAELNL